MAAEDDTREAESRIEAVRRDGRDHLDLGYFGLTDLPESLGGLTQLRELNLRANGLNALPEWLGQLTQLQALHVSANVLSALPESLGRLTKLRTLSLSGNRLTALPEWLGRLTQLRTLRISANRLTVLPEWLGQLTQLWELDLAANGLTALPEALGRLAQLEYLYLAENGLTALPETLGRLAQLRELRLSWNGLTALPEALGRLTQLQVLDLHENPALGIPPEVLGPDAVQQGRGEKPADPRAVLAWYFRNRAAAAKRPILEAKVILVGWGAVGKTSLRRRLLGEAFDPKEEQTHKIDIAPWPVRVGADNATLHVWDFGGQEVMHATHQFFLTKRSLYVLVLAGREKAQGAQDAEYWLRLIDGFGGGSPTLVVLNKQDACPFDLNQKWLREKYPFIKGFVATDCASGRGLPELEQRILGEVDQLPDLRTEFDARWMAVKDAVAGLKKAGKKRMAVEDYYALCRAKGEEDRTYQTWLLGFLHDLGVVVCFHDDPRLAKDGVLDPQWVVDGIYRVLNEPALAGRDGRASYAQVRRLLPPAEYTDAEVRILLDMMEKFQLAFWLDDRRTELVIPELMTEQEPDSTATFPRPDAGLQFELKYTFLPGGLLPRFIVATRRLSAGAERWRSGVILRKGKNAALVRADVAGTPPRVGILVNGPPASRRGLLDIIRNEFRKIHATLPGLGVEERVPVPGHDVEPLGYDALVAFEDAGKTTVTVFVAGRVVELPLAGLLDGIGPKPKRAKRAAGNQGPAGLREEGGPTRAPRPTGDPAHQTFHLHAGDNARFTFATGGGAANTDSHDVSVEGDNYGQVGQSLTGCTNAVAAMPAGERKDRAAELVARVEDLLKALPADRRAEAAQVVENLEMAVKQAARARPDRDWYTLSARGLLEAAAWVEGSSGPVRGAILTLGKAMWPDFALPE